MIHQLRYSQYYQQVENLAVRRQAQIPIINPKPKQSLIEIIVNRKSFCSFSTQKN